MPKKKKSPSPKRGKTSKKKATEEKDPEWQFLQERFETMSADFDKLADMIPREKK